MIVLEKVKLYDITVLFVVTCGSLLQWNNYTVVINVMKLHILQNLLQLLLHLTCYLYAGAFGKVFEGVLHDHDKNMVDVRVAVKTIRSTSMPI